MRNNVRQRITTRIKSSNWRTKRALLVGARILLEESQKLVPVDTGRLKASGHVESEEKGYKTAPRVVVAYEAPYAIYVHENLECNHPNGGQAKYLEEPARTHRNRIRQAIADDLRKYK